MAGCEKLEVSEGPKLLLTKSTLTVFGLRDLVEVKGPGQTAIAVRQVEVATSGEVLDSLPFAFLTLG